ncbi:MAG: hypothetical protein O7F76_02355 [Planctomycetota bacterium]|nr:hypothetical protein [Planctomycetota bacterium]
MSLPSFPDQPADHAARSAWLEQVARLTQAEFQESRARGLVWSWTRLLTFAAIFTGGYYYLGKDEIWGAVLAPVALLLFVWAVRRHDAIRERTLTLDLTRKVISEAGERVSGKPVIVRSGHEPNDLSFWEEFLQTYDQDDSSPRLATQEIDDLDLFGEPLSVFGVLNRTSSPVGAARLASALRRPLNTGDAAQERQTAVRWFAEHGPERLHVMAAAAGMRSEALACAKFVRAVRDTEPLPRRIPARFLRIWALAAPLTFALGAAESFAWIVTGLGWLPLTIVILVNLTLSQHFNREVRPRLRPWLDLDGVLGRLHFFARITVQALPSDGLLGEQRLRLVKSMGPGCLPSLERIVPLLYLGLSGLVHTIIDVLVFWDLQVLALLERSYLAHRGPLLDAVAALAECEMLTSLACFAEEEPDATWPEFLSDGCQLDIENGRHPLIPASTAVANSLTLDGKTSTWIVTGSNMSGKSTFLRMAAVNVVLAEIGSAVTARRMRLTPLRILTDLRIRDDLSRQESYFLAEVRQIRRMVELAETGHAVFGLIDEPFRGTNSEERIAAAGAVILSLIQGSGVFLIATHDAALTQLADNKKSVNRHFRESFDHAGLVFDYRLQSGPAESRNALKVLEAEGYPEKLTRRARRILSGLVSTPISIDTAILDDEDPDPAA